MEDNLQNLEELGKITISQNIELRATIDSNGEKTSLIIRKWVDGKPTQNAWKLELKIRKFWNSFKAKLIKF